MPFTAQQPTYQGYAGAPLPDPQQQASFPPPGQPVILQQPILLATQVQPGYLPQPPAHPVAPAPVAPQATSHSMGADLQPDEIAAIKGSGKAKWFVLAVLLLGGVGGVLYWRMPQLFGVNPAETALAPEPTKPAEPAKPPETPKPPEPKPPDVVAVPAPGVPTDAKAADAKPGDVKVADAAKPVDPKAPVEPTKPTEPTKPPTDGKAAPVAAAPAGKGFDWYLQQGLKKRERGQPQAALELYEKAEELQPGSAEPTTGKGFCLYDLGNLDGALAAFQSALGRNPRFADAILGMAEVYKDKGAKDKALEFYRKYLEHAPNGPDANLAQASIERLTKE